MRRFEGSSQAICLRAVCVLARFVGRSPVAACVEGPRSFHVHLVDEGASPITLNATLSGLKLLFDVTLSRGGLTVKMQPVSVLRTLPVVLSREEVRRLITAAWKLKKQTASSSGLWHRVTR